MSTFESWTEDLLPTKWSRRTAGLTVVATAGAFGAFSLVPTSLLPESAAFIVVLRLLVSAAVLVLGTVITLVIVVRPHNRLSTRNSELDRELASRPAERERDINALPPIKYNNRGIV